MVALCETPATLDEAGTGEAADQGLTRARGLASGDAPPCPPWVNGTGNWTLTDAGATFAAGDRAFVRFSGEAQIDGDWSALEDGPSAADEAGGVVVAFDRFNSTAVYSVFLSLEAYEAEGDPEMQDSGGGCE